MNYRIVLRRSSGETAPVVYWWVLKSAGNGAVLATSETYLTRRRAVQTASALADALVVYVEDVDGTVVL